jgi:hypothetical protein
MERGSNDDDTNVPHQLKCVASLRDRDTLESNSIHLRFETSSNIDSQLNALKDLNDRMSSLGYTNIQHTRICDGCEIELPLDYLEGIRQCHKCNLKYDLCIECQKILPDFNAACPIRFGCKNIDTYTVFGKKNTVKDCITDYPEVTRNFILENVYKTVLYPLGGIGYYYDESDDESDVESHLSWNCIRDLWIYYRSTDPFPLDRYGCPSSPIKKLSSHSLTLFYFKVKDLFEYFVMQDTKIQHVDKALMMCFIYPNGDECYISRLYGAESELRKDLKFIVVNIAYSGFPSDVWSSRYFGNMLKSEPGREIPKKTQIISVGICIEEP